MGTGPHSSFVNFWVTGCKTVFPVLSDRCLSCLSVSLVYYGQILGWIKMKLGMEVGLGPGHIVLHGDPAPLPQKGAESPIFGPILQHAQCSHCKRCISYSNSVRLSVCLSVRPSVRPSVTRRYYVKTTARSTVQFAPLDSKICLVL